MNPPLRWVCNLCGGDNEPLTRPLEREEPSCERCQSTVRTRAMLRALSLELFGVALTLDEFPRVKSLRGLGVSDPAQYADRLAQKFDYRNTFYHREPRFDIVNPPGHALGTFDFIVSSEVLEHVPPPVDRAFQSAANLLKPTGVLVMTVPYSIEASMKEHFPQAHEFGLVRLGGRLTLVNRTREGQLQTFDDPVFHIGWGGDALEMREFTEESLRGTMAGAGFHSVHVHAEDDPGFGILHAEKWSLPIAARRGPFSFSADAARDLVDYYREVKQQRERDLRRYEKSYWVRAGRKLGLV